MSLSDLIPTLQFAIGPVILISGIGLVLLSMTNRFGRVIDGSRLLTRNLKDADEAGKERIIHQLRILASRARVVRAGIAFAAVSLLMAALLIISLFLAALLQWEIAGIITALFIVCMVCLIASLAFFIVDINQSLKVLWLEMPPGVIDPKEIRE